MNLINAFDFMFLLLNFVYIFISYCSNFNKILIFFVINETLLLFKGILIFNHRVIVFILKYFFCLDSVKKYYPLNLLIN